jgi:sec-independent protein translocase protein TatA
MFGLGWPEVIVILGVGALIFGSKKIPEMGSAFGKTLRGFREGLSEPDVDDESEPSESQEE